MSNSIAQSAISRINMSPIAVAITYVETMAADLQTMAKVVPEEANAALILARTEMLAAFGLPSSNSADKSFAFSSGVAVIPVTGMLLNRFGQSWGGYATGYNFIRTQMNAALADPDVKGIIFDVNSYGGEVSGMGELSDDIYNARSQKPSLAMVDANAHSAAYGIASSAGKMIVTPSGSTGSIGTVMIHASFQGAYEKEGIKITPIHAGANKVDGNPYSDLPEDVKATFQAKVDSSRQLFANQVARNRGMQVQAILDTEARTYSAAEALSMGLIDAVQTPSQAVAAFLNELSRSNTSTETTMTGNANPSAEAQATADARKAERTRIAAITTMPEASGKAKLANHLALSTEMSVEDAKALLLAAAPEAVVAAAPAAKNPLEAAMDATETTPVGADAGGDQSGQQKSASAGIIANARLATGGHNFKQDKGA